MKGFRQEAAGVRQGHGPAELSSLFGWFLFSGLLTSSRGCTNKQQVVPNVEKVTCNLCFNLVRIYLPPATDALVLMGKQVYANQNIVVLIT